MKSKDQTKAQLADELAETSAQTAGLEASATEREQAGNIAQWNRAWLPTASMFVLLCVLVCLDEILDFPHLLLGAPRTPINWREAIIEMTMIAGVGLLAVSRLIHDITERKQMEQQLRQQEQLAAVGQLAGGIAHDFNNLLTTIMLYAQMGLGKRDLPPDAARYFETILDESRKAAELVQQILDFSRRAMLEVRPLDLASFTGKVIDILRRTIPKDIRLVLEIGPGNCIVEADPTRIQQVLMNLATNARDAMPEGGELRFELARTRLKPGDEPPVAGMSPLVSPPHPSTPLRTGAGGTEGGGVGLPGRFGHRDGHLAGRAGPSL